MLFASWTVCLDVLWSWRRSRHQGFESETWPRVPHQVETKSSKQACRPLERSKATKASVSDSSHIGRQAGRLRGTHFWKQSWQRIEASCCEGERAGANRKGDLQAQVNGSLG